MSAPNCWTERDSQPAKPAKQSDCTLCASCFYLLRVRIHSQNNKQYDSYPVPKLHPLVCVPVHWLGLIGDDAMKF